jgi:hypothetical protein
MHDTLTITLMVVLNKVTFLEKINVAFISIGEPDSWMYKYYFWCQHILFNHIECKTILKLKETTINGITYTKKSCYCLCRQWGTITYDNSSITLK